MHSVHWSDGRQEIYMHHNGDFSGDVKIIIDRGSPKFEIDIPFKALERLVGKKYMNDLQEKLDGMQYEDILPKIKKVIILDEDEA